MNDTINANLQITITDEDIDDIMSGALDTISYWCERCEVIGEYLGDFASEQISKGGKLKFVPIEPITDNDPEFILDRQKLVNAIATWLSSYGSYIGNVIELGREGCILLDMGNVDGPCCDSILQIALFGEIVFA